jgi:hypothetical protein
MNLTDFDQVAVRVAQVAADLRLAVNRRRQELRAFGFPLLIAGLDVRDPQVEEDRGRVAGLVVSDGDARLVRRGWAAGVQVSPRCHRRRGPVQPRRAVTRGRLAAQPRQSGLWVCDTESRCSNRGWKIAAMRHRGPESAEDLARFASAYAGQGVCALGLTGDESAFPPGPFARACSGLAGPVAGNPEPRSDDGLGRVPRTRHAGTGRRRTRRRH